jgi:hypothetical protein
LHFYRNEIVLYFAALSAITSMAINLRDEPEIFRLEVDGTARSHFLEMARWTRFLAIFCYILMALALVGGVLGSFILSKYADNNALGQSPLGPALAITIVVVIVGIYFYPTYSLLKYSTSIKEAVTTDNKELFNQAIRHLKNVFKYFGILMIIVIAIYGLQIVLTLLNIGR